MASKKNYSRYFIILQEDEKGYVFDREKSSSGYVKLEKKNNKCKVSFYAQNINPGMEPYYMILICKNKDHKKLLVLGKLAINEQGKIDMYCDYDIDNIANSKMSMQHIIGATIGKVIDKDIISLMSGFVSSEVPKDWKGYEVIKVTKEEEVSKEKASIEKEKSKKESIKEQEKEQQKKQEKDQEKKESKEQKKKDEKKENDKEISDCKRGEDENQEDYTGDVENYPESIFEKYENSIEKNIDEESDDKEKLRDKVEDEAETEKVEENVGIFDEIELDSCDQKDIGENIEFCTLEEDILRRKKESVTIEEEEIDMPTGKVGEYFKKMVYECEEINSMGNEIPYCRWYKIIVNSLEDLYDSSQFDRYTILYYPMICYYSYIREYNHFCVGYKCDKLGKLQYIIYAIPGLRDKEFQPYGGRTGFVTWIPSENKEYGYWIMFYDFRKSSVVVPIKK